ncbi:MAG: phosphoenolpyruvate--protein phosphotransferase [Treponema sp.]|jgi:phosphotransferase system enzyme I (PtsI)|nr:phosphoenolpyruvate--protein phosphotransferase [Treponema sp.]
MVLKGIPVSPGLVLGTVYIYRPVNIEAAENVIGASEVEEEKVRYANVLKKAAKELHALYDSLFEEDPEKAKIFSAHLDILNDPAIQEEIIEGIESELWTGDWAVWKIYAKFIKLILKAKDPMIRERSVDFEDVRKRILRIWNDLPEDNLSALTTPVIIAARDLLPSDTATLDRRNVLAIITEMGGSTSHSAIIARSYGIPAILGISELLETITHNSFAAVDALTGEVFLNPDSDAQARLRAKRDKYLVQAEEVKTFLKKEPITSDGTRIDIGLNIGNANDEELSGCDCTDFVGLFRTEFLYMERDSLPSEDEQFAVYRKVLTLYGDRAVTLRTLDIGGDKTLSYMDLPKEDNPFLGKRALRLCFCYPDIFKTQLRAALRASVFGNLNIMLPMVGSMDDIRKARAVLEEVKTELGTQGIPYSDTFKFGIMIEIPSIAMIADIAAKEVDFASIGTNDLCQYLTAVDRMNPEVSEYYQDFHPAMFRIIGNVAQAFIAAGKPLSVCGEMGGNPLTAAALVGLGFRKLSMGLASVAPVKRMLSRLSIAKAEEIASTIKDLSTAAEVECYLKQKIEQDD